MDFFSGASIMGGISKVIDLGAMEQQDNWQSDEAASARDWAAAQRANAYQTTVADLKKAGLNPMLAYGHGPSPMPGAAQAGGAGSAGESLASSVERGQATETSSAQQSVNLAQVKNIDAQTALANANADKAAADAAEARARTATYPETINSIRQQISESQARIPKIIAETDTAAASASQMRQQITNMQAELPRIKALTASLESLTRVQDAQIPKIAAEIGKTEEETRRIMQDVKANLPEIQRQIAELEAATKGDARIAQWNDAKVNASKGLGKLASLMRVFNPLSGLFAK